MAYQFTRNDRLYVAKQVSYDTVRNTAGAANVAAADACKHISFSAKPLRSRLNAPDKESSAFLGYIDRSLPGRFNPQPVSVRTPLFTGSGAGVAPDNGVILESAFGKETISAGVSVTYGADGSKYMNETSPVCCELWHFNTGGKNGVLSFGSICNRLQISAGQDFAEMSADFLPYNVLTQNRFAAASTAEKGGLTAWPSEPGTQTYTGSELTGFTGSVTLDGVTYTTVRSLSLSINWNRQFRADKFAVDGSEYLPSEPFEMMPEVMFEVSLHSTTASNLAALLAKIAARTAFDASFVLGNTAGGIYTFSLNNLIVPDGSETEEVDGDDRKAVNLTGLRAQATSTSVRDEVSLVIT